MDGDERRSTGFNVLSRVRGEPSIAPARVALVRGPVVFVQEGNTHEPIFRFPNDEAALNTLLVPDREPGHFRFVPPDKSRIQALVRPFYTMTENYPYRMYVDLRDVPFELWKA